MVYGAIKGGQFERKICGILSLWVSHNKRDDVFWRSAMSGGRATLRSYRKRAPQLIAQAGDISALGQEGEPFLARFFAECKFYADLGIFHMITGRTTKNGPLDKFWRPYLKRARELNRAPFVVAKQNRIPELVFTDKLGVSILMRGLRNEARPIVPIMVLPRHEMHVFWLSDIVRRVDPTRALRTKRPKLV